MDSQHLFNVIALKIKVLELNHVEYFTREEIKKLLKIASEKGGIENKLKYPMTRNMYLKIETRNYRKGNKSPGMHDSYEGMSVNKKSKTINGNN